MHSTFRSILKLAAFPFVAVALALPSRAETKAPSAGAVDFGTFARAAGGGEFVEVNIHGALLKLAARLVEKEEPEVAKLLADLHAVRVNVIGMDDSNREELAKRVSAVRDDLTARGWNKVVTVQQKNEDVGVYIKLGVDEVIEGVVVTVIDGRKEAVFVNVVGTIRPEQLVVLGEHFGIKSLKHAVKAAGV